MPKPIFFAVGPEYMQREGLTAQVLPWEDGQRIPAQPGTFEWWYFDAHLEDGSTAVIVFATKPIVNPRSPLLPNLSLTITRPDGRKTAEFVLPPAQAFHASPSACDVQLDLSHVRQEQQAGPWIYRLHAESQTMAADLAFTGLVPPWRPGAGKSYFGDLEHFFAWLPAIPYGSVQGTLTYDGQAHTVRGAGYHDHNWGNLPLPSILDHWTWGRAHVGDYSLIFVEQIASRRYGFQRIPVFLLARGDKVLADDSRCLRMQASHFTRHPGGRLYPEQVDFIYEGDGGHIRLALREPKLIEATSLLGILPPLQRRIARWFANPYYFRFNANLQLEVDLPGCRDQASGTALYELMMLK